MVCEQFSEEFCLSWKEVSVFTKSRGGGRGFSWQQSLVLFLFFFYDSNVELTVF